ncbi:MAG: 2-phosphosulfolactate phosphatase [Clostridiaceae bacterium]|nr:2-phosphosulfolactate phosphatase [Clostridiaceae bacterium]
MNITIDHLTAGAERARGITVIIDVFRAYSFESYAFHNGAKSIYPIADIEVAYEMKRDNPDYLLAGERHAKMGEGFDFGNSPSQIENTDLFGRTLIHTTSAGTQGIAAAKNADIILLGALVNANATAHYIKSLDPSRVSLVCMGLENREPTDEDTFCAEYIRALLLDEEYDIKKAIDKLPNGAGKRFFVPENQAFAPERDFYLCTEFDRFSFALKVAKDKRGHDITMKIDI